ncbi:hypothetical protein KKG83_05790 [Candidatus Micrarchaeota archaeon]|nr:hypothetical protein [Candidatus Micrarchaeota archaeon]
MKNCKGQIFTTDFVFAVVVLLFILVISTTSFGLIQNALNEEEFYFEMQEKAFNASQALVSTQGDPNSWELLSDLNVNSLGLAKERNVIDEGKLQRLVDLNSTNYQEIKEILGLGKYEFYFRLTSMQGQTVKEFGTFPGTEEKVIVIERYVLLNGEERKFLLGVFK